MKKSILTFAIAVLMVGFIATSCKPNTSEEQVAQDKLEEAQIDLEDAKEDLSEARRTATSEEWQTFKDDTNAKIDSNTTKINDLKVNIRKTGKQVDQVYQKNIDVLEQKNQDLKNQMDTYKNDANSDWKSFKKEFNHDIDQLGESLKDFTVNNKK